MQCFGRDRVLDVGVGGVIKFKVTLQAYYVKLWNRFLWVKVKVYWRGFIDTVLNPLNCWNKCRLLK